jgi:glycosidase
MIAIAKRWLARGLDGFRLDASRHIIEAGDEAKAGGSPETHDWWLEFAREVRRDYPDTIFIGENWTTVDEVAPFFGETPYSQLDINFNFDLAAAIVGGTRDDTPGLIQETLCDVADYYPPHALDAIFLTNHDMVRVATQVRRPERARLAASLLFTLPGVPFVYYGEELGLVNGPGDEDPEKRTPMRWTEAGGFTTGTPWMTNRKARPEMNVAGQQADPDSMWHLYRRLIRLRKTHPALTSGGYRSLVVEGSGDVIAFERFTDEERIVVVANFADSPRTDLTVRLVEPGEDGAAVLFGSGPSANRSADGLLVSGVGPRSVMVYQL